MFDIPCIIFAGGKSSRMGEDKSLLPFGKYSTLSEFQYHKLSKLFSNVYISTKDSKKFDFKANFIEDIDGDFAPTLGFISVFKKLEVEKIFVISVDTPFISQSIIKMLIEKDNSTYNATIARLNNKMQPLCGIYHKTLLQSFERMQENNEHKLGFLLKNSKTHYVDFLDTKAFLNLNHPHEYKEALKLLST